MVLTDKQTDGQSWIQRTLRQSWRSNEVNSCKTSFWFHNLICLNHKNIEIKWINFSTWKCKLFEILGTLGRTTARIQARKAWCSSSTRCYAWHPTTICWPTMGWAMVLGNLKLPHTLMLKLIRRPKNTRFVQTQTQLEKDIEKKKKNSTTWNCNFIWSLCSDKWNQYSCLYMFVSTPNTWKPWTINKRVLNVL